MRRTERVEDLRCFMKVSRVLKHNDAVCELGKVVDFFDEDRLLRHSFPWDRSPQGQGFWSLINRGVVPLPYREDYRIN